MGLVDVSLFSCRIDRGFRVARTHARPRAVALALLSLCAAVVVFPSPLHAQPERSAAGAGDPTFRWFPAAALFAGPITAPLEPRFTAGVIATTLFERTSAAPRERPPFMVGETRADAQTDVQAAVAVGTTIPIWQRSHDRGAEGTSFQVMYTDRFRLEERSRDALGGDWIAALSVEGIRGRKSARFRLLHRSAHLGDEFIEQTGARRVEYSYDAIDALFAHHFGQHTRMYGGGSVVLRSQTHVVRSLAPARVWDANGGVVVPVEMDDEYVLQAGLEIRAAEAGESIRPIAAFDWQRANHEDSDQFNLAVGLEAERFDRTARLLVQCHTGASSMGQFFLSEERFCGANFTLEL